MNDINIFIALRKKIQNCSEYGASNNLSFKQYFVVGTWTHEHSEIQNSQRKITRRAQNQTQIYENLADGAL